MTHILRSSSGPQNINVQCDSLNAKKVNTIAVQSNAVSANTITDTKSLVLDETATQADPGAGKGRLWVKNTTPSSLYFTDDAGGEVNVSAPVASGPIVESGAIVADVGGDCIAPASNIEGINLVYQRIGNTCIVHFNIDKEFDLVQGLIPGSNIFAISWDSPFTRANPDGNDVYYSGTATLNTVGGGGVMAPFISENLIVAVSSNGGAFVQFVLDTLRSHYFFVGSYAYEIDA